MNRFVLSAALAVSLSLVFSGVAHAKIVELLPQPSAQVDNAGGGPPRPMGLLPGQASELPEPEVFAMMVVGLVLIGYRARRESSEKFK